MSPSRVPDLIADYFRDHFPPEATHPVIREAYRPGLGWRKYPIVKRVSCSWLRKMRSEGYTHIGVVDGREADVPAGGRVRVVDFRIDVVLRHQNRPLSLRECLQGSGS